jgi:Mg2+/Co2+ transporter CorC
MLVPPVLVTATVYEVVCDFMVPKGAMVTLKPTESVNVVVAVLVPSDAVIVYVPVIPSN